MLASLLAEMLAKRLPKSESLFMFTMCVYVSRMTQIDPQVRSAVISLNSVFMMHFATFA